MEASVEIVSSRLEDKGRIYTFKCRDAEVEILFLNHSIERAKKWQLPIEQIGECLLL
jgi:hypothetical protein